MKACVNRPVWPCGIEWLRNSLAGFAGNYTVQQDPPTPPISGLVTYDFATTEFRNDTVVGISTNGVVQQGRMLYVPNFGKSGILVSVGGNQWDKNGDSSDALLSMNSVQVYDTDAGRWYEQTVTGDVPEPRKEFCMAGATSNNRTYEILLYAGWDGHLGPQSKPFDEAFVLSLPAFRWFKAEYIALHPRHSVTCNHAGGGQVITVGGSDTMQQDFSNLYQGVFKTQDPFSQGIAVFDLNQMGFRTNYSASQTVYAPNKDIQSWYNNQ